MTVSDAIGLNGYLTDPWLSEHTGLAPLLREPNRVREATLRYLEPQDPEWRALVSAHAGELPPLPDPTRLVVFMVCGNEENLIEPCLKALSGDLLASGLRHERRSFAAGPARIRRRRRSGSSTSSGRRAALLSC